MAVALRGTSRTGRRRHRRGGASARDATCAARRLRAHDVAPRPRPAPARAASPRRPARPPARTWPLVPAADGAGAGRARRRRPRPPHRHAARPASTAASTSPPRRGTPVRAPARGAVTLRRRGPGAGRRLGRLRRARATYVRPRRARGPPRRRPARRAPAGERRRGAPRLHARGARAAARLRRSARPLAEPGARRGAAAPAPLGRRPAARSRGGPRPGPRRRLGAGAARSAAAAVGRRRAGLAPGRPGLGAGHAIRRARRAAGAGGPLSSIARRMAFYVTTPIYYVNAAPHLGHAYTHDRRRHPRPPHAPARRGRVLPHRHRRARRAGRRRRPSARASRRGSSPTATPSASRTLMPQHQRHQRLLHPHHRPATTTRAVQEVMQRIHDNGHVYKGIYEGWYCPRCADFKTETRDRAGQHVPDPPDPARARARGELVLPALGLPGAARALYAEQPDFVMPAHALQRGALVHQAAGCTTSRSRARSSSGACPCPWDPDHVFYVWFDALLNYYTALRTRATARTSPTASGRRRSTSSARTSSSSTRCSGRRC